MKRVSAVIFLFCVLALSGHASAQAVRSWYTDRVGMHDWTHTWPYLVEGKVIKFKKGETNYDLIEVSITHVYWGPASIEGDSFFVGVTNGGSHNGELIDPIPVGETAIWPIWNRSGDYEFMTPLSFGYEHYPYLPVRLKPDPKSPPQLATDIAGTKHFAECVERLQKAAPENQVPMLREFVAKESPMVSRWATHLLEAFAPEEEPPEAKPEPAKESPRAKPATRPRSRAGTGGPRAH